MALPAGPEWTRRKEAFYRGAVDALGGTSLSSPHSLPTKANSPNSPLVPLRPPELSTLEALLA